MKIVAATLKSLEGLNLIAEEQEIKRAYWRHCKQRQGFNIGLSNQVYLLTEYLQLNQIAKPLNS